MDLDLGQLAAVLGNMNMLGNSPPASTGILGCSGNCLAPGGSYFTSDLWFGEQRRMDGAVSPGPSCVLKTVTCPGALVPGQLPGHPAPRLSPVCGCHQAQGESGGHPWHCSAVTLLLGRGAQERGLGVPALHFLCHLIPAYFFLN